MYPVSGQFFGCDYDNTGNRKTAISGGDVNGGNLRTTTSPNGLNQYSAVATLGYEDIIGVAIATNSVMVNGGTADRDWNITGLIHAAAKSATARYE